MQVRVATVADAEAIETIRIRGWQTAYRHVFPPEELDKLPVDWSRWAESLAAGHWQACRVAEDNDVVVGWVTFGPARDADIRAGEVYGLYVDPDRWGTGAGRALLERAEAELACTWDEAILWTLDDNPRTRRFYDAAGWRFDGTTGSFDRFGVSPPTVRYAKRLSISTSRS
jgi:GNAT superfamily N-acetyltransferase